MLALDRRRIDRSIDGRDSLRRGGGGWLLRPRAFSELEHFNDPTEPTAETDTMHRRRVQNGIDDKPGTLSTACAHLMNPVAMLPCCHAAILVAMPTWQPSLPS